MPILHREVGPRDGLQFERTPVSLDEKLAFIDQLVQAGCRYIEAGSFVRADKVPQMAGSDEIARILKEKQARGEYPGVTFAFLTLNPKGADEALKTVDSKFGELAVVVAASDEFCKANMGVDNMDDAFSKLAIPVIEKGKQAGVKVRGYVSTIFEGQKGEPIDPTRVAEAVERLLAAGAYEVSLGDTTGAGTPDAVEKLINALIVRGIPLDKVAMHFHDTKNNAVRNVEQAYNMGITIFDSAAGGLGGCPFAKSPKGNLATEGFLDFCSRNKIETGIDMEKIVRAVHPVLKAVGKPSPSAIHNAVASQIGLPKIEPAAPKPEPVRVEPDGSYPSKAINVKIDSRGVAYVAMNRPKVNAFDEELIKELAELFAALDKDPRVKVAVLSGEGRTFSAGADLNWMQKMAGYSFDENVADARKLAAMLEQLHTFSKPLVARVHGAAMGGGVGLTAVCDYAVAEDGTKFAFTEVLLGLRPSTISSYCIPKLGDHNSAVLFCSGQGFLAADARNWGLVSEIHPAAKIDAAVESAVVEALTLGKDGLRQKAAGIRNDRQEIIAPRPTAPQEMIDLITGVNQRLADTSPAGRAALMEFTATDIANARGSDEAKEKIPAFLAKALAAANRG